ncbi:glycosyltransferase family 4 protein [bacterium]|nr:glycosyltransferase family 4 protein [bacterium]
MADYNRRVSAVLHDFDPDLIWVSNLRTFLSIFPAAAWRHVPVVWNIWLGQQSRGLVRFMNAFALRRARRIVTEYQAQAGEVFTNAQMERARAKIRTVYTGHEVPELSSRTGGAASAGEATAVFYVGTMGAFSPRKDQRLFLEAARLVREDMPDVRFRLAGEAATPADEPYAEELRAYVRETGLEGAVDFCGWIDRPYDFLDTVDVYVQSSVHEGLPGAVREAMLHGLPVIGTDVGGTGEAVADGETGCLVPRDARAMADAILRLCAEPETAAEMGRRGRERAERLFSRDAYLKNYQEVLDEVLLDA